VERRPDQDDKVVEGPFSRAVSRVTGTPPEPPAWIEGVFRSEEVAEAVARQLRAAFPGSIVTVEDGKSRHRVRVHPRR
jgi:sporulation related protein